MADETVIGQDAAQIDMAFEVDAEQVEGLALVPVGAAPDVHHGGHDGKLVVLGEDLDAQAPVVGQRQQLADRSKLAHGRTTALEQRGTRHQSGQ